MEKVGVFKTFFLILKLDIKKCPKWILKKKFAKMKITFFSTFFLSFFRIFLTLNDLTTFDKNRDETIRKKVKKSDFFGIFRDFFEIFLFFSDRMDNFWIKFRTFWIMVDNL
jgi:hypothetical protein